MKYLITFFVLVGIAAPLCSKDYETIRLHLPTPCLDINSSTDPVVEIDDWVMIMPNPNDGIFQLQFADIVRDKPADLVIYNMQGGIVYFESIPVYTNFHSIDLSTVSSGVYFVTLRSSLVLTPKKLILY